MIDVKTALNKLKVNHKDDKVLECLEFDDFYAFVFVPKFYDESKDGGVAGTYETVTKSSGLIGSLNPASDLDLFFKGKVIDIQ